MNEALVHGREAIRELPEFDFKVLVLIEPTKDGIDALSADVLVVSAHKGVQLVKVEVAVVLGIDKSETGDSVEVGLSFKSLLLFLDLNVVVHLLFKQSRQLKLNNLLQLARLVSGSLGDLGSQFGVVIGQAELEEVIVVQISILVLVEHLKDAVQVDFLDVVDLVMPEESTDHLGVEDVLLILVRRESSCFDSLKSSVGLEVLAQTQILSLLFD